MLSIQRPIQISLCTAAAQLGFTILSGLLFRESATEFPRPVDYPCCGLASSDCDDCSSHQDPTHYTQEHVQAYIEPESYC